MFLCCSCYRMTTLQYSTYIGDPNEIHHFQILVTPNEARHRTLSLSGFPERLKYPIVKPLYKQR
jgi:hypothetical protein